MSLNVIMITYVFQKGKHSDTCLNNFIFFMYQKISFFYLFKTKSKAFTIRGSNPTLLSFIKDIKMKYGYARVSTEDQDFLMQEKALIEVGCERIFSEKISATILNRPELDRLMDQLRPNDVLVVFSICRLVRSIADFCKIVDRLIKTNVTLVSISNGFNTSTTEGQQMAKAFAWLAEQELAILKARQKAGISIAKAKGKHMGRPKGLSATALTKVSLCKKLSAEGFTVQDICVSLGISKSTFYRYLDIP